MRVYALDRIGNPVRVEGEGNSERCYAEVRPCTLCREHRWAKRECTALKRAVALIATLSKFELDVYHALTVTYGSSDAHDAFRLGSLLRPLRQPFECDSYEIGLWKTVLRLAIDVGPADMKLARLVAAYKRIRRLEDHVCEEHKLELERVPAPRCSFQQQHLDWIDSEDMLEHLPGVRGKSPQEMARYFKQQWEALDRCRKCRKVLHYGEREDGEGVCLECASPEAQAVA